MYHKGDNNMKFFIFLTMIFLHIYDDFFTQSKSFVVDGKQKSWWEKNCPDKMYKNDYKVVLAVHGFSWAFVVHIPFIIMMYQSGRNDVWWLIGLSILGQSIIHSIIDDLKANRHLINLFVDQYFHLVQITVIWTLFFKYIFV